MQTTRVGSGRMETVSIKQLAYNEHSQMLISISAWDHHFQCHGVMTGDNEIHWDSPEKVKGVSEGEFLRAEGSICYPPFLLCPEWLGYVLNLFHVTNRRGCFLGSEVMRGKSGMSGMWALPAAPLHGHPCLQEASSNRGILDLSGGFLLGTVKELKVQWI